MSEYFVGLSTGNYREAIGWLNNLVGKDAIFLLPYYYGAGLPAEGRVVRLIDWQLMDRVDGVHVVIARIEIGKL